MASPSPAARQALADATRRWPSRSKVTDGIMGDRRHQQIKSDHNQGNAVDITHDPRAGCDGAVIAAFAIQDPRVTYVIFNRRKYERSRPDVGWRPFRGDPHTGHCHISIRADMRGDTRPWGWATAAGASLPVEPAPAAPSQVPPPARRPPAAQSYPHVPLRMGARGELVRRVQQGLRASGWDIDVDGIFGPDTHRVVRRFQQRRSLDDDGVVGRRTWNAMFAA
jgi:hypothetical protein